MALKPVKDIELLVQSTFTGHSWKQLWVAKAIAGGGLYVFKANIPKRRDNGI